MADEDGPKVIRVDGTSTADSSGNETRIVLGAPYVFSRQKLRKPAHVETVTLRVRGVLCHNGCGLYYVAPTDAEMKPDDRCPDCNAPPKAHRIGREPEKIDVAVHMAFGNVVDVKFLRSRGRLSQRQVILPVGRSEPRGRAGLSLVRVGPGKPPER